MREWWVLEVYDKLSACRGESLLGQAESLSYTTRRKARTAAATMVPSPSAAAARCLRCMAAEDQRHAAISQRQIHRDHRRLERLRQRRGDGARAAGRERRARRAPFRIARSARA